MFGLRTVNQLPLGESEQNNRDALHPARHHSGNGSADQQEFLVRRRYGAGGGYYYGGGSYPPYSYYSNWPPSSWGYGTSPGYYPYSYWGGYPYGGYNNYYSYYTSTYGYNAPMVAAVQQRLGRLGYYHGVVDGVIGPQTRGAIGAFESRNGLAVDGTISRPLLDSLGLC